MGLMEIELAKLDYRERLNEANRRVASAQRAALRRTGRTATPAGRATVRGHAKIDSPVLSLQLGRFRYRLWFTRTVAL